MLIIFKKFNFFLMAFIFFNLEVKADFIEIAPKYETPEIATSGDAADDPAIWFNATEPHKSLVLATDKRSGVYVYDLRGKKLGFTELGNINNIDLRSIDLSSELTTFIVASNRSTQSIDAWLYKDKHIADNANSKQFALSKNPQIQTQSNINIYGICVGNDPELGLIIFATEDGGPNVEVWQYINSALKLIHTFTNNGESEGCVYDDENRTLFISEENINGVLKAYRLESSLNFNNPFVVDSREGNIGGDPEGVAIYKTSSTSGYLVLSSQGDSKYNVYNREAPYEYIDSFRVGSSIYGSIDGASDTDGVAILSNKLNRDFPQGLLVVQDG